MADADLLDEIKRGFKLKNDSELAGFLGVTRATIHNCRFAADRRLGPKARFSVLDRIAFLRTKNITGQWLGAISNTELARRIVDWSIKTGQKRALRNIPADAVEVAEKELIDIAKIAFECDTDDELADILGIARNTISAVRNGRTSLGLDPRMMILNRIEPFDIERVKHVLDSTDDLIEEIRAWTERQKEEQPPA